MNVIVVGNKGMLGRVLCQELANRGHDVEGCDLPELDITDLQAVTEYFRSKNCDVIINVAAYTNVDGAESDEESARKVNVLGAENVAKAACDCGARCFYISTDYVFDGTKKDVYEEEDAVCPVNAYGRTKMEGEQIVRKTLPDSHLIVRTSWLYGQGGKHFPGTMLKLASEKRDLKVIDNQIGSPTYTRDLARALSLLAENPKATGTVHATNSGWCSWYEFAAKIFELSGIYPNSLSPCDASEYKTAAARPQNSRLSPNRLIKYGAGPLSHWADALARFLEEEKSNQNVL